MKLRSIIKPTVAAFAVAMVSVFASAAIVTAQAAPDVVFNNGTGVDVGNETNFLRIGDANGANTTEVCTDGQSVDLWFYVHNTNPTELNGADLNGVGVARNTKVDIDFKNTGYTNSQEIAAKVSADNSAVALDNAFITCAGKQIAIEYAGQSMTTNAPASTSPYALTGNIMDGATLGYSGGRVPGCFEYRAYIKVKVTVRLKPTPPPVKVPATCDLLTATISNRTVTIKDFKYTMNDATLTNVVVDMGDGKNVTLAKNQLPYNYTYATDGEYTVKAIVKTSLGDVTSNACAVKVNATTPPVTPPKPPTPPVTPPVTPKPPVLVNTGAGSMLGLFASVSIAGAIAHRLVWVRRFNRG